MKLESEDREFLGLVAEAAFANPFGEQREDLDRRLSDAAGIPAGKPLDTALRELGLRLERLENAGTLDINRYAGDDRAKLEMACLFDSFHRYRDAFDQHIRTQLQADDEPVPVPFHSAAIGELTRHGFSDEQSVLCFGVFFQLRRAFFFIDEELVGQCRAMRTLRMRLWNSVFTSSLDRYLRSLRTRMEDFSTLLLGETGSGKGAAAAAIGRSGFIPFDAKRGRFTESFRRSFTSMNLSQFPEGLLQSELFGHRKGAFTGAMDHHEGILARCSPYGAIFLDEIGDVATPVQIKLLQVLQARVFSPVGSHDKRRFQGRVIAATNKPLDDLRRSGEFRDDFYYRLCSDVIVVPPLRERLAENPAELSLLLGHLLQRMTGTADPALLTQVHTAILDGAGANYPWPGNVRELEQAARRVLLTGAFKPEHSTGNPAGTLDRLRAGIEAGSLTAEELLSSYCRLLHERHGTYEAVAARTALDRRTARRHVVGTGHDPSDRAQ